MYSRVAEKNDSVFGDDRIISVANMYFSSTAKVSTLEYLKTYNVFRLGDIAFEGHESKTFRYGRFVENDIGDGIVSHVFEVFRPTSVDYDLQYWKYAINNEHIMRRVLVMCTKSATMMHNIVPGEFLRQSIFTPAFEEQESIGKLLQATDRLLALHQRKQKQAIASFVSTKTAKNQRNRLTSINKTGTSYLALQCIGFARAM